MDATSLKIMQLWMLAHQSGRPDEDIAGGIYFGITNTSPPPEIEGFTNPGQLIDHFKKIEIGRPLTIEEHLAIGREFIEMHQAGKAPSLGVIRLIMWLPNIALLLALAAIVIGSFSWIVLGLAVLAKIQNGFARFMAGRGHEGAGLHANFALLAILVSFVVSLIHIFSGYSFY